MADQLTLEVLTPRKRVLSVTTPWVTVPGSLGELGILPQHIPLVTTVDSGVLQFEDNGKQRRVAVHYGYAQVQGDHVTVLAEMAELGEEIDRERARMAERRALGNVREEVTQDEERKRMDKHVSKVHRAMIRQQAST